jgi:hypothetical protein
LLAPALAGLNGKGIQATRDEAPGLLASVAHPLGAPPSPDLFHGQYELSQAVSAPLAATQRAAAKALAQVAETLNRVHADLDPAAAEPNQRGLGHPPQAAARLEQVAQEVEAARHEHQRLAGQRAQVTQRLRAMGHASHFGDLERGVRRHGTLIARDIREHIATVRTMAQQAQRRETCLARIAHAARVVPTMPATIEVVSGEVRQQVRQLDLAQPASYAMHAQLLPSYSLDRVASTRTVTAGKPWRALATRLRTPLFEPGGVVAEWSPTEQSQLTDKAQGLAEVFQRSSSTVEGRHGYLSRRTHPLRGLDPPRKRACLTAVPNFFITRSDGTTAAERLFGQKPRSMFAAILGAVEIPSAPLSPPRRALG